MSVFLKRERSSGRVRRPESGGESGTRVRRRETEQEIARRLRRSLKENCEKSVRREGAESPDLPVSGMR